MKIFISYSWKDEYAVVEIDNTFKSLGINLTRDIRDLAYHQSIKEFMENIRETDYVLMVISQSFLQSFNCMYEVMEFIKDKNYVKRILPIVLKDVRLNNINDRLGFVQHWDDEYKKLESMLDKLPRESTSASSETLEKISEIRNKLDKFLGYLNGTKYETFEELKETNYKAILKYIGYSEIQLAVELMKIRGIDDTEKRDAAIDEFLYQHKDYAPGYLLKGYFEAKKNNIDNSIQWNTWAIEKQEDFAKAYYNRAKCYRIKGEPEKALADYNKSIELKPDYFKAYNNRGLIYGEIKMYDKSIEDFRKILESLPQDPMTHYNLYLSLSKLNDEKGALEELKLAEKYGYGNSNNLTNNHDEFETLNL